MTSLTQRVGKTNGRPFFGDPRTPSRGPFPAPRGRPTRWTPWILAALVLGLMATPYLASLLPAPAPPPEAPPPIGIAVTYGRGDDLPGLLDVSTRFPSTSADAGSNCAADNGVWSNRANANADEEPDNDATSASAAPLKNQRFCDDWRGFGFALPSWAVITAVSVSVEWRASTAASVVTLETGLFTLNGPTSCTRFADGAEPTTYTTRTYDYTSCKSWTIADFNSDRIGVSIACWRGNSNTAVSCFVDYVSIAVTYVPEFGPAAAAVAVVAAVLVLGRRRR